MKTKFKKNGRRLLAAILCLVMAVMALPMSAFAWTSEEGVSCTSSFGDYYVGSDGGYYPEEKIHTEQENLNRLYDSYTEKYGLINSRGNYLAFASDESYFLLCSLEVLDDEGNFKRKADMFTKRTIKPHREVALRSLSLLSQVGYTQKQNYLRTP